MPAAVSKSSKANSYEVKAGNETVMFRYEKNFFHKTGLFVHVRDSKGSDATRARVAPVSAYGYTMLAWSSVCAGPREAVELPTFGKQAL